MTHTLNLTNQIAFVAYEANRAWCKANGDFSHPAWNDAPEWQKESVINGVEFHRNNPNAGDSASHDSWMAEKANAGWVFGETKDPEATPPTHPCMVPFNELPEVDQKKDALFGAIIRGLLGKEA